jgi:four helix bundle protein
MKENLIKSESFNFALVIIELYKKLVQEKEFVISKQVLRSGTSIGANIAEAECAYSKKDFASKMTIAFKESNETRYWLELLQKSQIVTIDLSQELSEIDEIIRILASITKKINTRTDF